MTSPGLLSARARHTRQPGRDHVAAAGSRALEPVALIGACAAGLAAVYQPLLVVGACAVALLVALVWVRPPTAAYLIIGTTPLVAGIDRGVLIPLFRPNEALLLLLGATLSARWLFGLRSGAVRFGRPDAVEIGILLFAVTNSLVPLVTMTVRGQEITLDDLLYSLVLWKLLGLYWIVRSSVRDPRSVRNCLLVSLAAAVVVGVIGILQGLDLFGVRGILAEFYAPFGDTSAVTDVARGGATLALPAAVADLMIMNLAVLAGLWLRERRYPFLCAAVAGLLILATLAAGEFSTTLGLVLAIVLVAWIHRSPSLLGGFGLGFGLGIIAVWPIVIERLSGFALASGMPASWVGRLRNLRTYFWPDLFSHGNYLLGVRPSARVPVATQSLQWVWIESGYTWLLWGGGIPLLLSYVYLTTVASARGWLVSRRRADAVGAAGSATFVAFVVIAVLMLFDPHVTYRGSADEAFALLALTAVARRQVPAPGARGVPARATAARPEDGIDEGVRRSHE
ncbi:hypothetical protein ACI78Q_07605 [Geodermatophilus sp. SYSU D00705]